MNKKALTVFALIGIFLCGAVVGGVISVRYVRGTVQKRAADQQLNSQQWTRITNRLNPTEEQREKIRGFVTAYMQEQQSARKISQAATEQLHNNIRSVLTPDQAAEYEKIRIKTRESEKMWQRWLKDQRAKYGDMPVSGTVAPAASGTNAGVETASGAAK